jgi:ubiquinone/menaquinone biosynthesis C-methylase UbiE
VLEVSIGSGVNLPFLFELPDLEVVGIDISFGQLIQCQKMINKHGWSADLFLAMAEALPFKGNTFDTVFHVGGINFFTGKQQAINEMIRVARPGCKIVIADEAERFSQPIKRSLGLAVSDQGEIFAKTSLLDLVPNTMKEIQLEGIWKMHGRHHGYCLTFKKPAYV